MNSYYILCTAIIANYIGPIQGQNNAATNNAKSSNPEEYQNYYNDYDRKRVNNYAYMDEDPSKQDNGEVIKCYVCHLEILNGVYVGEENCDIKFDPEGIKLIECDGKCGSLQLQNDVNGFMMTRNCMKGCKNYNNDLGHRQCCQTDLCNGSAANCSGFNLLLLMVAACVCFAFIT